MTPSFCHWMRTHLILVATLLAGQRADAADALTGAERAYFENKIRPVLVKHCYECHSTGAKKVGGGLLLDSREGLAKGGQSGPAVAPRRPDESLLLDALRFDGIEMPPEQPLPENIVHDFAIWVRHGAKFPEGNPSASGSGNSQKAPATTDSKLSDLDALWSFRSRTIPELPQVEEGFASWPQDPMDHFVLAGIRASNQSPAGDAASRILIRRLFYDLIGLPPTAEEAEQFVEACESDRRVAIEEVVDSLLARPQFGERWGRHWLDVARYAESNGDDGLGRNATFPYAWRYRDYVIDALNHDVPYDQFVTEQIAGDLLPAETAEQRNRQLVATGFLAVGAKPASAMNKNFAMDVVDNQINVVSTGVMGLSVACARCHDHKHDPIPTRDYYSLAGIFTSTETLYGLAGNEKLTAPPTPLHQLSSSWGQGEDRVALAKAPLKFPVAYETVADMLNPTVRYSFAEKPEGLTVEAAPSFTSDEFAKVKSSNIHGQLEGFGESYSVSFWFRNQTPNNKRPITAYLFSRAKLGEKSLPGDHIGIGGNHEKSQAGKLFVFNGNVAKTSLRGSTVVEPGTWNHVLLSREGEHVRLYLNGNLEIDGEAESTFGDSPDFCIGTRSDAFAPLDGNLAELSLWSRAIKNDELDALFAASGRPRGVKMLGVAMGVRDKQKVEDCKIHIGGESGKLGPVAARGVLSAYAQVQAAVESRDTPSSIDKRSESAGSKSTRSEPESSFSFAINSKQSGRRELAAWLTHSDHPQTSRVMVNRVWLHLMGRGLVATPDDFGVYGARPSNPELLDHLAERFVQSGWSTKRLIRHIVLSRTYQLDSKCAPELLQADPDNRLFARHQRRRLDAESLRDSILQASRSLDLKPPHGSVVDRVDSLINWPPGEATNLHQPSNHRSVYLCMLRHAPPPELVAFDLPDGIGEAGERAETTSPTQSLFLLNNPFVTAQSDTLAQTICDDKRIDDKRIEDERIGDSERVRIVFRRILQREPTRSETQRASEYIEALQEALKEGDLAQRRFIAWSSLCQALFASNEFRYVD